MVDAEDIERVITPDFDYKIYELTEYIATKKTQKAYSILQDMINKNEPSHKLFVSVYNHFRRLLHISLNGNLSRSTIAGYLSVKEYAVSKAEQQLKYFSKKKLKDICEMCADLDFKTKNSMISLDLAVEMLVLKILE